MLETLQRIVQEVGRATRLDEALRIMVRSVKQAMAVDVCGVYLAEGSEARLVLMAAEGLNPGAVGRVRLAAGEGLVGLVAERKEPLNLHDAWEHPRFRYFPETGEERYHAFLGVPIVHYRRVLGVLFVQQRETRLFSEEEVAFFVTVAAQLSGAILHALHTGGGDVKLGGAAEAGCLQGVRGAGGVAVGTLVLADPLASLESIPDRRPAQTDVEEHGLQQAIEAVREEMHAGGERMSGVLPADAHAIFDVYLMLLESGELVNAALRRIRAGNWAPGALRETIAECADAFEQMTDPYLRARAEDIRTIGRRILRHLQPGSPAPREYPDACVLAGREIGLFQISEVPAGRLAGIVCTRGSSFSHTVVLARALGIPAVMGLSDLPLGRLDGSEIAVDGDEGRVYPNPPPSLVAEYRRHLREQAELSAGLQELRELPATTPDGARVALYVNTGVVGDSGAFRAVGAEGIGLYRTEFPFMLRQSFPAEEEQLRIYREVLAAAAPAPVTLRTLDVGGDKALPYFSIEEDNPFLGWRGIRVTLDHPEIFLTQLRAALRANAGLDNLRLLLPMISSVAEVEESLALIGRADAELREEGLAASRPPLGVMIEVPSAVYQVAAIARLVDFLSVGTNDLVQFLLAVDRSNARVAGLYDNLHPAVLGALREVVRGARSWHRPVSVCGEMAGDAAAAILLLGLGIDALSMAPASLPRVKWALRSFPRRHARALAARALEAPDADSIRRLLHAAMEEHGLGALVRPRGAQLAESEP